MNLPMILYDDSFRIIIIARETSLETELHEISPFRFGRESRELLIELPFPRNSSGEKEGKERKKERSKIEECYVNEESAGSRRVWLTIHRRFGQGTRGILPSWKERALAARSDSARQSELQACTP